MDLSKELTNIILSSKDVLNSLHGEDLGIIQTERRTAQKKLAQKIGYRDYFFKFVLGYRVKFEHLPPINYKDFITLNSLKCLGQWLKSNDDLFIMHNKDDFIISNDDIDYLKETFSNRLTLYPRGGHMGNIWHKDNVRRVNSILGTNKIKE
jgi:hypothetical protein